MSKNIYPSMGMRLIQPINWPNINNFGLHQNYQLCTVKCHMLYGLQPNVCLIYKCLIHVQKHRPYISVSIFRLRNDITQIATHPRFFNNFPCNFQNISNNITSPLNVKFTILSWSSNKWAATFQKKRVFHFLGPLSAGEQA